MHKRNPAVKALFISGYPQDFLLRKGLDSLDVTIIQKPVSPQDVLSAIVKTIG